MWQGEVIKSIWFPVSPRGAGDVWQALFGRIPDNLATKGLPPPLQSTASGEWEGYQVSVLVHANKSEITVTEIDPAPHEPMPIPPISAEKLDGAIDKLRELTGRISSELLITRYGAAGQFVRAVDGFPEGVAELNRLLGNIFPDDSDSVLFQFNRWRSLESHPASRMNRLCKWGVARVGSMTLTVNGGQVTPSSAEGGVVYAYMHLDMNNKPFDEPIRGSGVPLLVDELWTELLSVRDGGRNALRQ